MCNNIKVEKCATKLQLTNAQQNYNGKMCSKISIWKMCNNIAVENCAKTSPFDRCTTASL